MSLPDFDPHAWFMRAFFWSMRIWLRFRGLTGWAIDREVDRVQRHGTNACHYVRVFFPLMPIALLSNVVAYGSLIMSVTYVPVVAFGLWTTGSVAIVIAVVAGIIYAMGRFRDEIEDATKQVSDTVSVYVRPALRRQDGSVRGANFFSLVWGLLVSAKRAVCPIIRFKQS